MLSDIVVDANVFAHADDPRQADRPAILEFLLGLENASTLLAVDEGFDPNPDVNSSIIAYEYFEWVPPQGLGAAIIASLASSRRVKEVGRKVSAKERKTIQQSVPDRNDHVYAQVAVNSDDRVLISRDAVAFPKWSRKVLKKQIGVFVLDVESGRAAL